MSLASARVTYLRLRYTAGRGNYLGSDSVAVCLPVCLSVSLLDEASSLDVSEILNKHRRGSVETNTRPY